MEQVEQRAAEAEARGQRLAAARRQAPEALSGALQPRRLLVLRRGPIAGGERAYASASSQPVARGEEEVPPQPGVHRGAG
eukprot:8453889-Pyramimonas_sp.AAC.1